MTHTRTAADVGGLEGFGPVAPERDEPVFHADWERAALALTLAMGATGRWTIDHARAARESLPLERYRANSYYQTWLDGLDALMLRFGLVRADELVDGVPRSPPVPLPGRLAADGVAAALARGTPSERPAGRAARFAPGDAVRTIDSPQAAHTRLPTYARGRPGIVRAVHGVHVFADRHAAGDAPPFAEDPQWLYAVEFDARALWGDAAEPGVTVSIDAFEPYLSPR